MAEKLTIEEMVKRKDEIELIVFDNNVFIAVAKNGEHFAERDHGAALREYFTALGFNVIDE